MTPPSDQDEFADDLADARRKPGPELPFDLMAICLLAICMAVMIGVSAGLVWLRVFGAA